MKSIALVITEMDTGGVSEALIEMLNHFDYSRYRVTLWVSHNIGEERHRVDPRVELRLWGEDEPLFAPLKRGQLFTFLRRSVHRFWGRYYLNCNDKHAFHCVLSYPKLDAEIYDYVVCYQGVSPLALPNALYRIPGRERILWIHGDLGREGKAFPFCKRLYHRFHRAIAVSQAARDLFVKQYGFPVERTEVFHNLIDTEKILAQAEEAPAHTLKHPAIVTVGRLSPEKGQTLIPAAMELLLERGLDAYWYLVGDGVTREELETDIQQRKLEDRVLLLGRQSNPFPYMKAADIYVQPSFSEGWGLTVQEALLLHKPVAATPVPAIMEQITHGENGLISMDTSPEALSQAVEQLLRDSQLRQRLAACATQSLPDNLAQMERLYRFLENENQRGL